VDEFTFNLILGAFMKICRRIPNVVKIGQKNLAIDMKN
jgi:hypothetical protein